MAVSSSDDCFRVEHALNAESIPFKLITQADDHLFIQLKIRFCARLLMRCTRQVFTTRFSPPSARFERLRLARG